MKRIPVVCLILAALLVAAALAGCGASPKARADDFARYFPEEVGEWELDDGATVRLRSSTVASKGHVTLLYEGPDDALAYIVIEAQPSEDAAEVASMTRERELRLQGLELARDRQPSLATATIAQTARARYALFQEGLLTVEVNAIAANEEDSISDDAFDALLAVVRAALDKVAK